MKITVYLTGGIACYKAVEVVRGLEKAGHKVRIVMTKNAEKFVGSVTLASLTKYPVLDDLWTKKNQASIPHVHLAQWTELAVVVPATASFIAKIANGFADEAATTTFLATSAPKLIIPAMNDQMWNNPATQRNLSKLKLDGIKIMEPAVGVLAEGYSAKGRMPELKNILLWIGKQIRRAKKLANKKIIVTAGGTLEAIDPVRFIGNRSSGKMGIAIAKAAANLGANVTLIYANITVSLPHDPLIKNVHVESTEDMLNIVEKYFVDCNALIMVAAVADWRVKRIADHKLKKNANQDTLNLSLIKTPDILKTVSKQKGKDQIIMGFAAETNELLKNASKKLQEKDADYIIANDVSQNVFGNDQDQVTILSRHNTPKKLKKMSKNEVAKYLVNIIVQEFDK
ncbi:bifunctional phosphopantothenoylcysteine decarboxylase/phosphopantothenate--cysteine ligase CoaBC [Lactobacillus acetotolerans]|jgi:phosphopantothenoylcysteine decarboxylase/phosphopantothenate--cysteine ligase|uniref:Coenzyme A biosynthesis bifunctional protein CoaBC n=2 Tax=Lactobacillus acetotolerans TaxID=1600 RepID=A0A0D6A4G5_9LACO|nr:bifunctional phosphopantothenoylcysteine decarboxylase/phosphopantothenate--cysteine ligase CoaBC [Lactobacillus acetotolerans]QFG51375.1 bifunctional phosphopantothenoylcysteine decarboxylase/phosphopantothenate--cysteine ligase CoaBC [Lactobacillus acetotolerans]QGV04512.1 bifunctional phosphopantothenoylcysteine decarboxylase/phosphopantothenate--cysteine ligase CoaBC [Lactobacillus acetotolerans]BAQ57350.1 pantothenate metabolism flavoprotein-like protein [Lactobacillus acetotolerans]GGV